MRLLCLTLAVLMLAFAGATTAQADRVLQSDTATPGAAGARLFLPVVGRPKPLPTPTPVVALGPPSSRHTLQATSHLGRTVSYWRYVPAGYGADPDRRFPVLIFVHGIGEVNVPASKILEFGPPKLIQNGADMCFTVRGVRDCFIVLSPHVQASWDNAYVDAVVKVAHQLPHADQSRIYLSGLSMGGGMALHYASEMDMSATPPLSHSIGLAAIVPICPSAGTVQNKHTPCNISNANLPVWAYHGDADATVPINDSRSWIETINGARAKPDGTRCGAPVPNAMLTPLPGRDHFIWDDIYNPAQLWAADGADRINIYQWLLLHKREAGQTPVRAIWHPVVELALP